MKYKFWIKSGIAKDIVKREAIRKALAEKQQRLKKDHNDIKPPVKIKRKKNIKVKKKNVG